MKAPLQLWSSSCELRTAAWIWFVVGPLPASAINSEPDKVSTLRPPRGELPPSFWETYGIWIISASALVILIGLALLWFLGRPKPPVIVRPEVKARRELDAVALQAENGAVLSRVSQILRCYFSEAFWFAPAELTTTEFCLEMAKREQIGPELSAALGDFLRQCDARKFAPSSCVSLWGAVPRALALVEAAEARRDSLRQVHADGCDLSSPLGRLRSRTPERASAAGGAPVPATKTTISG